jgi:hypothetical protein
LKDFIEKLFGYPPAVTLEDHLIMHDAYSRLRRLERYTFMRDDPPSDPPGMIFMARSTQAKT